MIKAVYARLEDRVAEARKVTGKPLTEQKKFCTLTLWDGQSNERPLYQREQIMLILLPTVLLVRMLLRRWPYCNLCRLGNKKVAVPTTVHCDHLIQAKAGAAGGFKIMRMHTS